MLLVCGVTGAKLLETGPLMLQEATPTAVAIPTSRSDTTRSISALLSAALHRLSVSKSSVLALDATASPALSILPWMELVMLRAPIRLLVQVVLLSASSLSHKV